MMLEMPVKVASWSTLKLPRVVEDQDVVATAAGQLVTRVQGRGARIELVSLPLVPTIASAAVVRTFVATIHLLIDGLFLLSGSALGPTARNRRRST
jgi:hypothetical protein